MRKLFALLLLMQPAAAFALPCTDFAGRYEAVDHSIVLTIDQVGCDRIGVEYLENGQKTREDFTLDGVKVKHSEFEDVGLITYVTPRFRGNDILIEIENHWTREGIVDQLKRRLHLDFTQKTNLLDQYGEYRSDGVFVPKRQTIYIRK